MIADASVVGLLIACALLPCPAQQFAPASRPAPPEPEVQALRLLEAVRAKDLAALGGLTSARLPDPFLVADALLGMHLEQRKAGKEDGGFLAAAEALAAGLARDPLHGRLGELVASWRSWDQAAAEREQERRRLYQATKAAADAGGHQEVVALLEGWKWGAAEGSRSVTEVRLLVQQAYALFNLKRLEEAQAVTERFSRAALDMGWLKQRAVALNFLGMIKAGGKDNAGAIALWREELPLREAVGEPSELANCLRNLGIVLGRDLRLPGEAIPIYERCHQAWIEAGKAREAANILGHLAQALESTGEHARSEDAYREGIEGALAAGDARTAIRLKVLIRHPLAAQGKAKEALGLLEEAHRAAQAHGDQALLAQVAHQVGDFHTQYGNFPRALDYFREHLALCEELGDRSGIASGLSNVGLALDHLGQAREALEALERSLALHREIGDRGGLGSVLDNLGGLLSRLGHHDRAVRCYEEAVGIEEQAGNPVSLAISLSNLGLALNKSGQLPKARECYEKALALAVKSGHLQGEAVILGNLGNIEKALGRKDNAAAYFMRALEIFRALGDARHEAVVLGTLSMFHLDSGEFEKAIPVLEQTRDLFRRTGAWLNAATSMNNLANAYLGAGRYDQAFHMALETVELHSRLALGLGEVDALELRRGARRICSVGLAAALVLISDDGTPDDLDLALKAFYLLENGKPLLLAELLENPENLLAGRVPPGLLVEKEAAADAVRHRQEELAKLAGRRGVSSEELARSRTTLEASYEVLEEAIGRIERAERSVAGEALFRPAPLDRVRAALPGDAALVLFLTSPKAFHKIVFWVHRLEIGFTEIDLGRDWSARLDDFIRLLATPGAATDETAASLYDVLFGKIEPHLAGVDRLLLSPDEDLALLPFEALLRKQGERFLERWEVTYVPSGTIYAALKQSSQPAGRGLLALGDPLYPAESKGGDHPLGTADALTRSLNDLPRLPGTGREVEAISEYYRQDPVTLLLREQASRKELLGHLMALESPVSSLHIACHGRIDPLHPRLTGLVLAGGEVLTLDDIYRLRVKADLVVLSACETGKGKLAQGEGVLGLVRGFLMAGAPRVIVSSWKVQDESTRRFFHSFYRHLREGGLTPSAALRAAKLERVPQGEAAGHPSQWAGFALWGRED